MLIMKCSSSNNNNPLCLIHYWMVAKLSKGKFINVFNLNENEN